MASKKQLDRMRAEIFEKEKGEQFAAKHGYDVAHKRLRGERKALEAKLTRAKFQ